MIRIGMVLAKPFPPDIRVEKEAQALIEAGFEVGLLAKSIKSGSELTKVNSYGLQIHRAVVRAQSIWERNIKGLNLLERNWLKPLQQFIVDWQPGVIHVHDFPLVKTVLNVAEPLGLPVVADLHENMPAAYRVWRTGLDPIRRVKDTILRNYHLWRWHEKRILPRCSRVIVVVPESAERLFGYGLDKDKIVIVSNTEDETTFSLGPPVSDILERYQHQWVVSYVGGVGPHRGLDTAIRAVPAVARGIPNFRLVIVGVKSKKQFNSLLRLARQLDVDEEVDIVGWQSFEKARSYIMASAICLVPHNDSEHTQTTVPHKLFQYMIAGKPVIVSDVRPLKRIVEETQSGLVFKANDSSSLAQTLIELYRNPDLREQLGRNGQRAARGPYAWRHDAQRLVGLYQKLGES